MARAEPERTDLQAGISTGLVTVRLPDLGGSLALVTGRLYREVQVKHPRNARFTLQNERGLFFVKVYQAALVTVAQSFEPGVELVVPGGDAQFCQLDSTGANTQRAGFAPWSKWLCSRRSSALGLTTVL